MDTDVEPPFANFTRSLVPGRIDGVAREEGVAGVQPVRREEATAVAGERAPESERRSAG